MGCALGFQPKEKSSNLLFRSIFHQQSRSLVAKTMPSHGIEDGSIPFGITKLMSLCVQSSHGIFYLQSERSRVERNKR